MLWKIHFKFNLFYYRLFIAFKSIFNFRQFIAVNKRKNDCNFNRLLIWDKSVYHVIYHDRQKNNEQSFLLSLEQWTSFPVSCYFIGFSGDIIPGCFVFENNQLHWKQTVVKSHFIIFQVIKQIILLLRKSESNESITWIHPQLTCSHSIATWHRSYANMHARFN